MNKHHGQTVEYIVRKKRCNLIALGKALNVNRRTLYDWFRQPLLQSEIIFRIGIIINHDFSVEFPDLFKTERFSIADKLFFNRN
jgi:hypothetical protein